MGALMMTDKELMSARFALFVRGIFHRRDVALGLLLLFWRATRRARLTTVRKSELAQYLECEHTKVGQVGEALCVAGYLTLASSKERHVADPTYVIEGNALWLVAADKRSARAREAGRGNRHRKKHALVAKKDAALTPVQEACRQTWQAYCQAYVDEVQAEPVRNAKNNALIKQFCQRLPHADAPHVIAFYVGHKDNYYRQRLWPLDLAVKDAEGLHVQWRKNKQITRQSVEDYDARRKFQETIDQGIIF